MADTKSSRAQGEALAEIGTLLKQLRDAVVLKGIAVGSVISPYEQATAKQVMRLSIKLPRSNAENGAPYASWGSPRQQMFQKAMEALLKSQS